MSVPYGIQSAVGQHQLLIGTGDFVPLSFPDWAGGLNLFMCGAGGNGGAGSTAAPGVVRGGGGGGASGAIAQLFIPRSRFIPRQMYLYLPLGGTVTPAYLLTYPDTSVLGYRIWGVNSGGNGAAGTTSNGTGGALAAALDNTNFPLSSFTANMFMAGAAGAAGNTAYTMSAKALFISGGPGGGQSNAANTNTQGQNITGIGLIPTISGGTGPGTNGFNGTYNLMGPNPYSLGGTGGPAWAMVRWVP